jgi:hypothetical protein
MRINRIIQDARPRDWFWMEKRAVTDLWIAYVGVYAWAIYCALMAHADERGRAMPSLQEMADETGMSKSEAKRGMKLLLGAKLIRRSAQGGPDRGPSVYQILPMPERRVHLGKQQIVQPANKPGKKSGGNTPQEAEQIFNEAWAIYPKRPNNNRQSALKAWMARAREGCDLAAMLEGTRAYARYVEHRKTEPEFIKMAATFYGPNRHWENDYPTDGEAAGGNNGQGRKPPPASPNERARQEVVEFYEREEVV